MDISKGAHNRGEKSKEAVIAEREKEGEVDYADKGYVTVMKSPQVSLL